MDVSLVKRPLFIKKCLLRKQNRRIRKQQNKELFCLSGGWFYRKKPLAVKLARGANNYKPTFVGFFLYAPLRRRCPHRLTACLFSPPPVLSKDKSTINRRLRYAFFECVSRGSPALTDEFCFFPCRNCFSVACLQNGFEGERHENV